MDLPSDLILKDPIMSDYHQKAPIYTSDAEITLRLDEALSLAGDNKFYQKRTTFFLSLQWLVIAFIIQGQSFLFLPPDFLCPDASNQLNTCIETEACRYDNPIIDPDSKYTIAVEFSLYCARGYYKSMTQMLFFSGSNVAILLFSFISDFKGRKPTLLFTYALGAIALFVARFSNNWYMLMFCLVFAGMGINPFTALSFILLNESAGDEFRQIASISLLATYGFGQLLFILLAYEFPNWKTLILYWIAIPLALQIITFLWIYESPKFLVTKKEFKIAKETIVRIAKTNKKKLPFFTLKEQKDYEEEIKAEIMNKVKEITCDDHICPNLKLDSNLTALDNENYIENPENETKNNFSSTMNEIIKNHIDHNDLFLFHKFPFFYQQLKQQHKVYTVLDLFRYYSQLKNTLILCLVYFSIYLTYFGLIFSLEAIGGNVYISALVQTSAELTAYICINFMIKFLQRKLALCFCLLSQSLACLLTLALHNNSQILILAMVSRFCVAMALSIVTVYTAEIYPTTVRSLGIGFTSFIGKFGCAIAPLMGTIFQYTLMQHPMVFYGTVAGFAGIGALLLKETKGLPLAEDIPEVILKRSIVKINRENHEKRIA